MTMTTTSHVHKKKLKRPLILASIMLAMFLAAIEATIVSTAMPSIVADLGGFSLYSWVFSAYLLTNAATVLIFGKLSDIFGRKPIFLLGISLFLIGSTLCGFAGSMKMLIVFRLVQGLGAGALMPIATTIVGDIYTKEERANIQGYLSSVWGISAVTGPALGGFFVETISWPFVFWMNIPLGILAMVGILVFFHEEPDKSNRTIDYAGAVYMFLAVSALMLILVEGGVRISWDSPLMFLLLSVTTVGFTLFFFQEKRAKSPMMPFHIWKYRSISVANLTSLTTGMILIGVSSYLPAFVQGVMERSATVAGFTLTTMSIGWPISSALAGRLLLRIGFRTTSMIGGISLIIGGIFFFLLSPDKGPVWAAAGSFFIGVGMGLSTTSFIVSIQSTVDWKTRGIATASNMFMRSLGSAVGAALLGGLLNSHIQSTIEKAGLQDKLSVDSANVLLDPERRGSLSQEALDVLRDSLTTGLHYVYIGILVLAVLSFLLITLLPKGDAK
ncbi:MDR family MFS transporter [Thalassobacillus pellis]|uniref:MDR family MFS transporter n=1 Tax=Thalassobacillus pellis TaxID=748008 RepID=UPI00195FAB4D|nr:MDR family MFS transporter [Thalassobacillus pellis]MBM7552944.1 EmrB/QacA subfamily drug resistance transporter [Thalassobacillus pellis]